MNPRVEPTADGDGGTGTPTVRSGPRLALTERDPGSVIAIKNTTSTHPADAVPASRTVLPGPAPTVPTIMILAAGRGGRRKITGLDEAEPGSAATTTPITVAPVSLTPGSEGPTKASERE